MFTTEAKQVALITETKRYTEKVSPTGDLIKDIQSSQPPTDKCDDLKWHHCWIITINTEMNFLYERTVSLCFTLYFLWYNDFFWSSSMKCGHLVNCYEITWPKTSKIYWQVFLERPYSGKFCHQSVNFLSSWRSHKWIYWYIHNIQTVK